MYYPTFQGKRPESKGIGTFLGMNRSFEIYDNEFSDMENMSGADFPYITTRQRREPIEGFTNDGESLDLIIADNERKERYDKGTGVKLTERLYDYYYRGEKQAVYRCMGFEVVDDRSSNYGRLRPVGVPIHDIEGVIRFGNNVICYPRPAVINTERQDALTDPAVEETIASYAVKMQNLWAGKYLFGVSLNSPGSNFGDDMSVFAFKYVGSHEEYNDVYCLTLRTDIQGSPYYGVVDHGEEICAEGARIRMEKFKIEGEKRILSGGDFGAAFFVVIDIVDRRDSGAQYSPTYKDIYLRGYGHDGNPFVDETLDFSLTTNQIIHEGGVMMFAIKADVNFLAVHQNRIWGTDTLGTSLYCSNATDFYDWKIDGTAAGGGFLDVPENTPWTAICEYGGYLYAFKQNKLYKVLGSNALDYSIVSVCDIGCIDHRAVTICDSVLYFLGRDGIYGFTGNIPARVSKQLDREYQSGVFESRGSLLFASLVTLEGEKEFLVYDTSRRTWHREDTFQALCFVDYTDGVYALGEDRICYRLHSGKADGTVPFSFTTKRYFYYFDQKAVSSVNLFLDMDEGASVTVSVSYDNQDFAVCGTFTSSRLKYIPVRLRKCDEFRIKVSGNGFVRLKQLEFILHSGGRSMR